MADIETAQQPQEDKGQKKRKISVKQGTSAAPVVNQTFSATDDDVLTTKPEVVHHTFSDEPIPPKRQKTSESQATSSSTTTTTSVESGEKKTSPGGINKLKFADVDLSKFTFESVSRTPKNHAKQVLVKYGDGSDLFVTPKLYMGYGFFKNDASYSGSFSFLGVPPDRKLGDPYTAEMEENEELMERVKFYDACQRFNEMVVKLASERSVEWFGKQLPLEKVRPLVRPLATPNVDKFDPDVKYPASFKPTFPVGVNEKNQFKIYLEGVDTPVDPNNYIQEQGKNLGWVKIGFTIKKVTFPNSTKDGYKCGMQPVAHQMVICKTTGTSKFVNAKEVF